MKLNQDGLGNRLTAPLMLCVVLLIASLVFGFWAFSSRQKYKNNTNGLINVAVSNAKQQQTTQDNQAFAIASEKPLIVYNGPEQYGSIALSYPRNWSSYVTTGGQSNFPVDGFFYPGTLPSVTDSGTTNFALRLQVENQSYNQVLQSFNNLQQQGTVKVTAYSLPKLPSVVGVEITGQITNAINGTLVVLPLRAQALEVWTEGTSYLNDFNNNILKNLTFSP